jgi:hypothetical protein
VHVGELRERLVIAPFDQTSQAEELTFIDTAALCLEPGVGSVYKLVRPQRHGKIRSPHSTPRL